MGAGIVDADDVQATLVALQPAPGAIFLSLRRRNMAGDLLRCMMAELALGEAVALRRELDDCIAVAAASNGV